VLFASSVSWAADAHSAWLELLLSLGLVGVATAVSLVVVLAARLVRGPPDRPLASRVLPVLFVYVLAMGVTGDVFGAPGPEPGLGFTLLGLCYAATAWRRRVWSPAVAPPSVPVERELSPAPI
jgi:O-antigen ligase